MFSLLKNKIFMATTAIPTVVAAVYFGAIASDEYVSESRFVVRSPEQQATTALGSIFKAAGFSRAQDDSYIVQDYILSRDALSKLDQRLQLMKAYSAPDIDRLSRFAGLDFDNSFEAFHRYYNKRVSVQLDSASSIVTLTTRAYSADTSHAVNLALLEMSENLINSLNERGRRDLVQSAEKEVAQARQMDQDAAIALAQYRNAQQIIDPEKQSMLHMQQISKLNEEAVATRAQIQRLERLADSSPQLPVLRQQVAFLNQEIRDETAKMAGARDASLANKAVQYQRLALEKEFTGRMLTTALSSLEHVRNEARKQQLYLERVVEPSKPDVALEPRRLRAVATVFVLGLVAWGILTMLLSSLKEHRE